MPIDTISPSPQATNNAPERVAIVQDWLLTFRGGEQVLDALLELYPKADLFTLFYRKGTQNARIENRSVHASFLNRLPYVEKYYRFLLPFFPLAIEKFDLSAYDLVISSSHCVAKGVIVAPNALHVCYSHTPMRYAWDRYRDYFGKKWLEPILLPFIHYLRIWDVSSAQRVDHFIANSSWVQKRIQKYYRRESEVICPFVNLKSFDALHGDIGNYYLVVSAFAPYKRIDLAIQACQKLGRKLVIVGNGQCESKLKAMATETTQFMGKISHERLREIYAGAKALLFPGEEDFGITPLESMAMGRPVIAYGRGGVLDSVVDGKTGIFFNEQTVSSLSEAILKFEHHSQQFLPATCRERAEQFSRERFLLESSRLFNRLWSAHLNHGHSNTESSPQLDSSH